MLFRFSPRALGASLIFAVTASTIGAIGQTVSFTTHTYANNNLWSENEGRNGHVRGDLNGDGREDFISETDASFNSGCGGSFAVTLSTSDGTYAAPVCYTIPSGVALFFAVGDFNADGKMDLVVTNDVGNAWLFLNNGNGSLLISTELTFRAEAGGIVAADVNHDGKMDLVYDTFNPATNTEELNVVFGNGDGTFIVGPTKTLTSPEPYGALAIGDFDNDGQVDILTLGVSQVVNQIFYGDGKGGFTAGPIFGPKSAYSPVDILNNGTMDVAGILEPAISTNYDVIDIEYGHYNRTITGQHISLKACASAGGPVAADFNGDGINDLIIGEDTSCNGSGPYTLNVLLGNGDGTFKPEQVIYSTADWISEWHVMRSSHSSKPDLTVWQAMLFQNEILNPEQLVLVNTTAGNFPTCTPLNFRAAGINVCGPASTVVPGSPVSMSFAGSNETLGRDMEIWVDGQKVAQDRKRAYSYYDFVSASVPLSTGQHTVDVFSVGWDYFLLLTQFPLTVGSTTCAPPSYDGLVVCSPFEKGTVTSPVTAWAAGNAGGPITRMEVWVDGVKMYSTFGSNTLKAQLNISPGWHTFAYYLVSANGSTKWLVQVQAEVK